MKQNMQRLGFGNGIMIIGSSNQVAVAQISGDTATSFTRTSNFNIADLSPQASQKLSLGSALRSGLC